MSFFCLLLLLLNMSNGFFKEKIKKSLLPFGIYIYGVVPFLAQSHGVHLHVFHSSFAKFQNGKWLFLFLIVDSIRDT